MLKKILFVIFLGNLIFLTSTHHIHDDFVVKDNNVECISQDYEESDRSYEGDTENHDFDDDITQDDTTYNGSEKEVDIIIDDGDNSVDLEAQQLFEKGNNEFSLKFLEIVSKVNEGKNIVVSPMSILFILAQLAPFARGAMRDELLTALNLQKKSEKAKNVFLELRKSLESQQNITVEMVSNIYSDKKYALTDEFVNFSHKYFGADVENIDFAKSAEAAETINNWVKEHTNNQIKDLVKPEMFSALTRIVLVNALYFKGLWKSTFNSKLTKNCDFYNSNNEIIKVPMMNQKSKFLYGSNEDFQIIDMPYSNTNMSMLVILPQTSQGLPAVMKKVQDYDVLRKARSDMIFTDVKVFLPKFKIISDTNLVPVMKDLGIDDMFDESKANFTKILENAEKIFVSDAVQKAYIEVEEKGTEAAAANAVVIGVRSMPRPPTEQIIFNANRPFGFLLMENIHNCMVFCGIYNGS